MRVELKQWSFGELIGLTFSLALAHMPKLLAIGFVCGLPALLMRFVLFGVLSEPGASPSRAAAVGGITLVLLIISVVVYSFEQAANILILSGSFTEKEYTIPEALRVGLRKMGPILAFSFTSGLVVMLGFLLFIVPGLVFMTWFYVGVPVIVLEDRPAAAAMTRSRELSAGHRWQLFGFIFIMVILVGVVTNLIDYLFEQLLGLNVLSTTLGWAVQIVAYVFSSSAPVVYYFHLRVTKEALDVEKLSNLVGAIEERAQAAPA